MHGCVAAFQPDPNFGCILAAYGGVFVAGSLARGYGDGRLSPTGGTSSVPWYAWQESRPSCTHRASTEGELLSRASRNSTRP
nr:hypothetical protein [Actinomadura sp. CNU-125]